MKAWFRLLPGCETTMKDFQSSNNVMITGATGFIGAHLCTSLVQKGYEVFGLSHCGNIQKISALLKTSNFHLLSGNILDHDSICRLVQENNITAIFHLAARLPHDDDVTNPRLSFEINAWGTLNLLLAASLNKVKNFIYGSSIDVYSEPPQHLPVNEKHPTRPCKAYGISKLEGELYSMLYANTIQVTVLRYAIVFGQWCKASSAVNCFIRQALFAEPLLIHGDGAQSGDFVYVKDVVKANLLALEKNISGIYNIGSGEETSVKELARIVIQLTKSNSEVIFTGMDSNRPYRFALDINRAQKVLGYRPSPLRQGLSDYIKHTDCRQ